ncbi:umecyanin-like [Rhodamnia argentea]|uniref:Umecyanin-like n=1 Tax=Rhodamnia argentea TaxID=178133 RepID=A0A8B8R239_9MYRT|nr:umecyanin-like [Rhodamnia argentea]XP_048134243.1 umecyanin-like [Rhodamnia argentea]
MVGSGLIVLLILAMTCLTRGAMAARYTVGDHVGWTSPPNITSGFYDDWAANKTFMGGDVLEFNYKGTQNLAVVSREEYDHCKRVSKVLGEGEEGEGYAYPLPANANGMYYFVSTIDSHCKGGQKLAIKVTSSVPFLTSLSSDSLSVLVSAILSALFIR